MDFLISIESLRGSRDSKYMVFLCSTRGVRLTLNQKVIEFTELNISDVILDVMQLVELFIYLYKDWVYLISCIFNSSPTMKTIGQTKRYLLFFDDSLSFDPSTICSIDNTINLTCLSFHVSTNLNNKGFIKHELHKVLFPLLLSGYKVSQTSTLLFFQILISDT